MCFTKFNDALASVRLTRTWLAASIGQTSVEHQPTGLNQPAVRIVGKDDRTGRRKANGGPWLTNCPYICYVTYICEISFAKVISCDPGAIFLLSADEEKAKWYSHSWSCGFLWITGSEQVSAYLFLLQLSQMSQALIISDGCQSEAHVLVNGNSFHENQWICYNDTRFSHIFNFMLLYFHYYDFVVSVVNYTYICSNWIPGLGNPENGKQSETRFCRNYYCKNIWNCAYQLREHYKGL